MIDYDPHQWRSHLFDIKGSMVIEILSRLIICVVWAVAVVAFNVYVQPLHMSTGVHSLAGVALGLLLVFRTNASYDRFWEGRKLWGAITNDARNLARLTRSALESVPELRDRAVDWTVTFAYATKMSLRGQRGLGPLVARFPAADVEHVLEAPHVPLAVADRLTACYATALKAGVISDIVLVALDQYVKALIDHLGACERIHKTPLPFAYVVHLRRAVLIYCLTLPFALVADFGWYSVLGTFLVAYLLFGIEEIGVEIEDPFGNDDNDLPLDRFCDNLRRHILGGADVQATPASEPIGRQRRELHRRRPRRP